jgi:IS30 family transposase
MKRAYKRWTNEEDLVIINLRKEGKTIKEIATTLNRSVGSITGRVQYLLSSNKIEKWESKLDYAKIADYVSKNPGNIKEAFRKYAKTSGYSINTISRAYYQKKQSCGKVRIKDSGNLFIVLGKTGHTINNEKITNRIQKSTLWQKIKRFLFEPHYFNK